MSGDTWPCCRSMIWEEGSAGSCLEPGLGEAAWYAEVWTSGTAEHPQLIGHRKGREGARDYKNRLSLALSLFLLLLSSAKSGSVCIMAFKKGDTLTYNHPVTCFHQTVTTTPWQPLSFHLLFSLPSRLDNDRTLQGHVFGLIQDSVLWHELSLVRSAETAASPFDPKST